MVSVSVLNLIEEVSKVRNRILGIHAAVAKFMVPVIENSNMYGNTPWSYLTSEEKTEVIRAEIVNINDNNTGIEIVEVSGKTYGVLAKKFLSLETNTIMLCWRKIDNCTSRQTVSVWSISCCISISSC